MIPIIAIVGRPNVGKSTLFNRLTKSQAALVADYAGVTRDRLYGQGYLGGQAFVLIDTGGLGEIDESHHTRDFSEKSRLNNQNRKKTIKKAENKANLNNPIFKPMTDLVAEQSWRAIKESDAVLFVVDAKHGLTTGDQEIAKQLRHSAKKVFLVANKTEGLNVDLSLTDFYALGMGALHPISASRGSGINDLMSEVLSSISATAIDAAANSPEVSSDTSKPMSEVGLPSQHVDHDTEKQYDLEKQQEIEQQNEIKLAIIGRPNVGKSTLVNRLIGDERVLVYDEPGTTRDSVEVPLNRHGKRYVLIDTAGVRRRSRIYDTLEKESIVKTLQAIEAANVVLFMIDARQNIADQDLHLLGFIIEAGKALVIAVNKWDKLPIDQKDEVRQELDRRLSFVDFAKVHFISARHGTGVGELFPFIDRAYRSATQKMSTPRLTRILEDAVMQHQPPLVKGRRIKLRYAHPGGYNPPRIIIHGNQAEEIPDSYRRYLANVFRKALKLEGTPVFIEVKSGANPFANRKNKLTEKQVKKRKRLLAHVKKK
jgi:GTPase